MDLRGLRAVRIDKIARIARRQEAVEKAPVVAARHGRIQQERPLDLRQRAIARMFVERLALRWIGAAEIAPRKPVGVSVKNQLVPAFLRLLYARLRRRLGVVGHLATTLVVAGERNVVPVPVDAVLAEGFYRIGQVLNGPLDHIVAVEVRREICPGRASAVAHVRNLLGIGRLVMIDAGELPALRAQNVLGMLAPGLEAGWPLHVSDRETRMPKTPFVRDAHIFADASAVPRLRSVGRHPLDSVRHVRRSLVAADGAFLHLPARHQRPVAGERPHAESLDSVGVHPQPAAGGVLRLRHRQAVVLHELAEKRCQFRMDRIESAPLADPPPVVIHRKILASRLRLAFDHDPYLMSIADCRAGPGDADRLDRVGPERGGAAEDLAAFAGDSPAVGNRVTGGRSISSGIREDDVGPALLGLGVNYLVRNYSLHKNRRESHAEHKRHLFSFFSTRKR